MLLAIKGGIIIATCEDKRRDFGLDAPADSEIVLIDDTVDVNPTAVLGAALIEEQQGFVLDEDDNLIPLMVEIPVVVPPDTTELKVDPRLALTASTVKAMKLADLDRYVGHFILRTYPTQKQADILAGRNGWQAGDLTTMNSWISARYTAAGTHRTAINALNTVQELVDYSYTNIGA